MTQFEKPQTNEPTMDKCASYGNEGKGQPLKREKRLDENQIFNL